MDDLSEIIKAFIQSCAKRWDGEWRDFGYKIYWAGTVLRIDLMPADRVEKEKE